MLTYYLNGPQQAALLAPGPPVGPLANSTPLSPCPFFAFVIKSFKAQKTVAEVKFVNRSDIGRISYFATHKD